MTKRPPIFAQQVSGNLAAFYAIYHGGEGLKRIASHTSARTTCAEGFLQAGLELHATACFDTLTVVVSASQKQAIIDRAQQQQLQLRIDQANTLGLSMDEQTDAAEVVCKGALGDDHGLDYATIAQQVAHQPAVSIPAAWQR